LEPPPGYRSTAIGTTPRVIYFTRCSEGEVVLLTLYAKSKTDNLTGPKLKEIRRALEE